MFCGLAAGVWEPLLVAAGYRFVWFDGLNWFYVAAARHAALSPHVRLPPNCFDQFTLVDKEKDALTAELQVKQAELKNAQAELQLLHALLVHLRNVLRHAVEQADNW